MAGLQQNQTIPSYDSSASNITLPVSFPITELMKRLLREKKSAKEFQDRRRNDWDDNYDLNRNKVFTNRLTQRQSVNIPLMKETLKTVMSKIDDPPNVEWKEKSGDLDKQLLLQEIWNDHYDRLNFEAIDIQDKKTMLLYGRAFKKLNWTDEGLDVRALDIYDVLVDPLVDPIDLETARFLIHQNIFRSLNDIIADERYEKKAKDKLKNWIYAKEAIVQSDKNKTEWERKMERLQDMGFDRSKFPSFAGGDIIVNLTEHYTRVWNDDKKKFEKYVVVYANEAVELLEEKLEDLIGIDFYPFVAWADDMETQDFWSDSIADLVRTPNKILNIWFSQMVENRTLRNFQMHWYDATLQGYTPQTYDPGPGKMLPAPGDPAKTIMPVDISGLDETMGAIEFLTKIIERASATPSIEKGMSDKKRVTYGEIKALIAKAQERTVAMMKFYRRAWQEFALKWYQMLDANQTGRITLYKTSRSGKIWPKIIYPSDWKSKLGYKPSVRSTSEQEAEDTKSIQKFMFVLQQFPNNSALQKIGQKRMMEMLDLTPEEMKEVEEAQKQMQQQLPQTSPLGQSQIAPQAVQQSNPQEETEMGDMRHIISRLQQINQLGINQ